MTAHGSNDGGSHGGRRSARGPELLGALLQDARTRAAEAGEPGRIDAELWRRVVGPRIGDRTAPGRLERKTLLVRVASAVWAQELSLLSDDIIARLRAQGLAVDALRFRVERIEPRPRVAAPAPPAPPPPEPLPEELAQRLARVDDPDLRTAIAAAAGYSLALDARRRKTSETTPGARAPRSSGSRSDRPDRNSPAPRARPRRRRGDRED